MLTATSELAIRSLILIGLDDGDRPLPPRMLAGQLHCSPSYLAKVLRMLVRSGLLRSVRGAHGGVLLARSPGDITLLDIIQACQGLLVASYCQAVPPERLSAVCAFHQAVDEVHRATVGIFSRWTLADLLDRPAPEPTLQGRVGCKITIEGVGAGRRVGEEETRTGQEGRGPR
jgi:Rrf2 family protein